MKSNFSCLNFTWFFRLRKVKGHIFRQLNKLQNLKLLDYSRSVSHFLAIKHREKLFFPCFMRVSITLSNFVGRCQRLLRKYHSIERSQVANLLCKNAIKTCFFSLLTSRSVLLLGLPMLLYFN